MDKSIETALWDWSPGVVAGGLPFLIFLGATLGPSSTNPGVAEAAHQHFQAGLVTHVLILGITTSCVSIVTAFSRMANGTITNFSREGRGPIFLTMITVIVLAMLVNLYSLHEAQAEHGPVMLLAVLYLVASLTTALYMEITIARLGKLESHRDTEPDPNVALSGA